MKKMSSILDIGAFICSVLAVLLLIALASGLEDLLGGDRALDIKISNCVAGYASLYGISLWIQNKRSVLTVGLIVVGLFIFAANWASISI